MSDKDGECFEVLREDFENVLAKFKTKDTKIYDFLIKAGDKNKEAIFKLCKRIKDTEEIPESFYKTVLIIIWKRKGPMEVLKNNRFLHMKEVLAPTVDALVVNQIKEPLTSRLSIYQVGHSIYEQLLTLKTVLARMEETGGGLPCYGHSHIL